MMKFSNYGVSGQERYLGIVVWSSVGKVLQYSALLIQEQS